MNIHFEDKALFEKLLFSSLVKVRVGSHMYGISDHLSDTDYLCIYVPFKNERNSFSFTNHQLQFKTKDADYNFVNLFNFIRNTINGDSTLNFELVNSKDIINTPLGFLYDLRDGFKNYMIIRSYLGMSKRDLKHVSKGHDDRDKNKKLIHALRGYWFAQNIYSDSKHPTKLSDDQISELMGMKNITDYKVRHDLISDIGDKVDLLRSEVNKELDAGNITRFMKVDYQSTLDKCLNKLVNSTVYESKELDFLDMSMIYDANENGIKYE